MAYEYESLGWQDFDGTRYEDKPDNLGDTHGIFVHVYDPDTGEDSYFWAYTIEAFDTWDAWMDYIDDLIEMGVSL